MVKGELRSIQQEGTMRSSLRIPSRNSRKIKGIAQMAATEGSVQRLTFYEDLYLKPYKKSATMPNRRLASNTPEVRRYTRRQSSITENQRKSWSQSPVNNPLLDSPPSARPLTLSTNGRKAADNKACQGDNNNNNDYLRLSETVRIPPAHMTAPTSSAENVYENRRFIQTRAHRSPSVPISDHVYEVIPAQFPNFYDRMHHIADESNYVVPKTVAAKSRDLSKLGRPTQKESERTNTNLRVMRRMGRSIDSIKTVQDNKLRSQSTILAPQLWMKSSNTPCLANSASCDNLLASHSTQLTRTSHISSSDKENRYTYTTISKHSNGIRSSEPVLRTTRTGVTSPKLKQSADTQSQKSMNSSLHNTNHRSMPDKSQHCHRYSSSYAGSSSAYENMAQVHKSLNGSKSEYVNVEEYTNQLADLNYADLDLTLPRQKPKPSNTKTSRSASVSPTKATSTGGESNDDSVEYTLINIAATEAARLACEEHQQDRQRRPHLSTTKAPC